MELLIEGESVLGRVILAHGAGVGMSSEFLEVLSKHLSASGLQVVRFDFPTCSKGVLMVRKGLLIGLLSY